ISITAGKGGDGAVRWRREKVKPLSGPGGGSGGRGGDVFVVAISDIGYLDLYRHTKDFKAENGVPGGNFGKLGADGEHLFLKFPVGSVLTNQQTGEVFELKNIGDEMKILSGGRGGL